MKIYQLNHRGTELEGGKEKSKKHHLEVRMEELGDLLGKNVHEFSKGLPSEEQLKSLLTHSFNCYDQLDFISLEYAKNEGAFWSPKTISEQMNKVMKNTKTLCNNIKNWLQNYSVELVRRSSEAFLKNQNQQYFGFTCKVCQNHTQEILLREARKEILGTSDWRELFDQELMMQQQEDEPLVEDTSDREYKSSVNYLSKVIKEMESSVQSYEKLNEKMEHDKDLEDHPALKVVEDLLTNLRVKLGQKYRSKEKAILTKLFKQNLSNRQKQSSGQNFTISEQVNLIIGQPIKRSKTNRVTLPMVQQNLVQKLQEENKRLLIERNSINELYSSTQNVLNQLTGFRNKKLSQLSKLKSRNSSNEDLKEDRASLFAVDNRASEISHDQEPEEKIIYRQRFYRTGIVQPPGLTLKKSMKESAMKRISLFNLQRIQSRKEELKQMFGKDMTEEERSQFDWEEYFNQIEQKNRISLEEEPETVDAACQWEDLDEEGKRKSTAKSSKKNIVYEIKESDESDDDSIHLKSKSHSKKKSVHSSSRSLNSRNRSRKDLLKKQSQNHMKKINPVKKIKKYKTELTQSCQEDEKYRTSPNFHQEKQGKSRGKKLLQTEQERSFYMERGSKENKVTFNKKIQKLGKIEEKNSKVNVSLGKIEEKSVNSEGQPAKEGKQRHTLGAFVRNIRMEVEEEEKVPKVLEKINLQRHPSQKGSKKEIGKHKINTQGSEKVFLKKPKIVVNFLFRPEHLSLFGGVSQSFSYQNDKKEPGDEVFNETQKNFIGRVVSYLTNLKGFKRSIYQNVIQFLIRPFETIQKPQFEFKSVSSEKLRKIVMKLLFFHKKRCTQLTCQHLSMFFDLIGFSVC